MSATKDSEGLGCGRETIDSLRRLLSCYEVQRLLATLEVCCIRRDKSILVSLCSRPLADQLSSLPSRSLYTSGLQVAIVKREEILPSLGLLSVMQRHGIRPSTHYAIVTRKAGVLFTYGRDVLAGSLLRLQLNPRCRRTPVIVVDEDGDMLGFGGLTRRGGRVLIRNLVDVGWYLRSGV